MTTPENRPAAENSEEHISDSVIKRLQGIKNIFAELFAKGPDKPGHPTLNEAMAQQANQTVFPQTLQPGEKGPQDPGTPSAPAE